MKVLEKEFQAMRGQEKQLELNFTGGLVQQFPDFFDCFRASVVSNVQGKQSKAVAADIDMSQSDLSRRLGPQEDNQWPFRLKDFVKTIESTGDYRPIYWLIEYFLEDSETKQQQALNRLARLVPVIESLVREAKGT